MDDQGNRNLIPLDDGKAGMQGVDKARVEKIINEVSMGSPYYANEQRKAAKRGEKIEAMLRKSAEFDRCEDRPRIAGAVRLMEQALERTRHHGVFVHFDMDMFFAAIEEQQDPSLKEVPFAVGSMAMLSTSNYRARKYGVRAAMPGYIAKRLCPTLRIVGSHFELYREAADKVRAVAEKYDPHYASGGLDELTIDLGPYLAEHRGMDVAVAAQLPRALEAAAEVAEEIRAAVLSATSLTASAGIAVTPALAKIVSNYNKPNGQYVLRASTRLEVMEFMSTLPVRKVPGIGKVTEEFLNAFSIHTCRDLYEQRERLFYVFTEKAFEFLLSASLGVMGSFAMEHAEESGGRKSLGAETTFFRLSTSQELLETAQGLVSRIVDGLHEEELVCRHVVLKLKFASFQVKQVSRSFPTPTAEAETIWRAVLELLNPFLVKYHELRLLGVRLGNFLPPGETEENPRGSSQPSLSQACRRAAKKRVRNADDPIVISDSESDDDVVVLEED